MITIETIDSTLDGKTRRWTYDSYPLIDESWIRYNGEKITTRDLICGYPMIEWYLDNQPEIDGSAVTYLQDIGRHNAAKFLNTYYEVNK